MKDLAELRAEKSNLREAFEAKKKQEWLLESARIDALIGDRVLQMHNQGQSLSAIMREYGTSDRMTVKRILIAAEGIAPSTPGGKGAGDLTWSPTEDSDTWRVETRRGDNAKVTVYEDEEGVFVMKSSSPDFTERLQEEGFKSWKKSRPAK